jgi:hypothetical protein
MPVVTVKYLLGQKSLAVVADLNLEISIQALKGYINATGLGVAAHVIESLLDDANHLRLGKLPEPGVMLNGNDI